MDTTITTTCKQLVTVGRKSSFLMGRNLQQNQIHEGPSGSGCCYKSCLALVPPLLAWMGTAAIVSSCCNQKICFKTKTKAQS